MTTEHETLTTDLTSDPERRNAEDRQQFEADRQRRTRLKRAQKLAEIEEECREALECVLMKSSQSARAEDGLQWSRAAKELAETFVLLRAARQMESCS